MSRIDLTRLRKQAGMSQRNLAALLQVRPSFLSAIENGRSRMPDEKLEKIKEIFKLDSLEEFMIEEQADIIVPPHIHSGDNVMVVTSHSHVPPHSHSVESGVAMPPHTHPGEMTINIPHSHSSASEQSESITRLLNHFHDLAHQHDRQYGSNDEETCARIEYLEKRNDRLSQRVDDLRDEVDRLRAETLRLKEILVKNGLPYS